MSKNHIIYQVDAFTDKPFGGNPAGVIFADSFSEAEKQSIAREMNLPETAFLSKSDKADYRLQWFSPTMEIELCGHATIASLHFLDTQGLLKNEETTFETLSGVLNCGKVDGKYYMQIPVFFTSEYNESKKELLDAIGIQQEWIDETIPFILLQNGYLYINLKKLEYIRNVSPDFKALKRICDEKNKMCITLFTLQTVDKESFAHLRFFAPSYGIDEDPVTGSANGPLMLVLERLGILEKNNISSDSEVRLTFEQGDTINRRGRVTVIYNKKKNELKISGNAVTVIKGELFI